jgi:hypothetical protein
MTTLKAPLHRTAGGRALLPAVRRRALIPVLAYRDSGPSAYAPGVYARAVPRWEADGTAALPAPCPPAAQPGSSGHEDERAPA